MFIIKWWYSPGEDEIKNTGDERKIHSVCLLKNNCFKDIVKPAHWVGHSQLRSLDSDDFFKTTPGVDEKKASVTGNTLKKSVHEKNPVLWQ